MGVSSAVGNKRYLGERDALQASKPKEVRHVVALLSWKEQESELVPCKVPRWS